MKRRAGHYDLPKPDKKTAQEAVADLLAAMRFDPATYAIFEIWDQETKNVVRNCKAVALHGSKLCVEVPSSVHRQELLFSKDRLVKRVNQAMGRRVITDIRFELKGETKF